MDSKIEKLKEIIANNTKFAIISHLSPDGDNLGSIISLYFFLSRINKKVYPIQLDKIPKIYEFITKDIPFTSNTKIDIDVLIAVDCADRKRLGDIDYLFNNSNEIIKIDHHLTIDDYGTLNIVNPNISSTCELIANLFFLLKENIEEETATALLMGILSDTGRYLYDKVDSNTFEISSKLLKLGANKKLLMHKLFQSYSLISLKASNEIINNAEFYYNNSLVITIVEKRLLMKYELNNSDVEDVINYYRDAEEVEVSCMLKEVDNNLYKVSFRSKNIDVNAIAEDFGGGGHRNASGCAIEGDLFLVKNKLIERFNKVGF